MIRSYIGICTHIYVYVHIPRYVYIYVYMRIYFYEHIRIQTTGMYIQESCSRIYWKGLLNFGRERDFVAKFWIGAGKVTGTLHGQIGLRLVFICDTSMFAAVVLQVRVVLL